MATDSRSSGQPVGVYSYGPNSYRITIRREPGLHVPESPAILSDAEKSAISVHRDAESKVIARKKNFQFVFDPPTGSFRAGFGQKNKLTGQISVGLMSESALEIRLDPTDQIFGLGALGGPFERRPVDALLRNIDTLMSSMPGQSYSSHPFFIIKHGQNFTGVFIPAILPMHAKSAENGLKISYYKIKDPGFIEFFVLTGTIPEMLQDFAGFTGMPAMPPLWAVGLHQSRWSYKTQSRVLEIAQGYRSRNIPLDAIHLDIHYMDRYRVFTFNRRRFPDPAEMNQKLTTEGIRSVAIIDPGIAIADDYPVYSEGNTLDLYCKTSKTGKNFQGKVWPGKTTFPDFTKELTRSWWGEKHKVLFEAGISGIWNDMNEPVLRIGKKAEPLKEDMTHTTGPHSHVRNFYAGYQAMGTLEGFEKYKPGERPFILTRGAFSGMQRMTAQWTGDNHSTFEHLRENLNMVMNLGLCGMPFAGADIGGFASGPGNLGVFKFKRNRELFARWIELGSLMPFCRIHTALYSFDQEPWSFGEEVLNIAKKHIRRRYMLLPYIYDLFFEAGRTGAPVVRPMLYHSPELSDVTDQFYLGPSLIACPVLEPAMKKREVSLPEGEWYEFETRSKYIGGQNYTIDVKPGYYPLFVKGGTVLPMAKPERNATDTMNGTLIAEVFPGAKLYGRLTLDDWISRSWQSGQYFEIEWSGKTERNGNIDLKATVLNSRHNPVQNKIRLRLPDHYHSASAKDTATTEATELISEDRTGTVQTVEIPLKKWQGSFEYRKH